MSDPFPFSRYVKWGESSSTPSTTNKTASQAKPQQPQKRAGGDDFTNLMNQEVADIDRKIGMLSSLPNNSDGIRVARQTGVGGTRDQQLRVLKLQRDRALKEIQDGRNESVFGDIGSAFSSGAENFSKGLGYLAGDTRLQEQARRRQAIANAEMTDYGREAREKGVLGDDMSLGQRSYAALLAVTESTPELIGGGLITAAVGATLPATGAVAIGAKILSETPRLAKVLGAGSALGGRELAETVGRRAVMTLAGMGVEGTQAGLITGSDVTAEALQQIESDPEAFSNSNLGRRLLAENNGDFEAAKQAAAQNVGRGAAITTGLSTALLSLPASVFEARILSGGAGGGVLREIGGGALAESAQEAPQSGAEQFIRNVSMQGVGSDVGTFEGVAKAAGEGAIVGGLMGGGVGGVAGAITGREEQPQAGREDEELASALAAREQAAPLRQGIGLLEDANAVELRGMGNISAGGLNYTPTQILEIATNNQSNPRIADIMSQPVSDVTKVQQVARILNQEEAARVEPEAVRRISGMIGGTTSVSGSRQMIADELSKIDPAIVAESPALSSIANVIETGGTGKQFVNGLRNIVSNYTPPAQQGETFFARPERGGEGSVVMTQDQVADEAQREREASQAFRMADVRQRRFDTATGAGTQREDLRAGAPEPQAQFFLNPEVYGEELGGTVATIVGAEGGRVRIQYEQTTEDGFLEIVSEDVDPADMFNRVVRGTPRMTQDLAGDLRRPKAGVGTDMNPRRSVDRTRTRAVVPAESGLPEVISPTRFTGFEQNTDQLPVEAEQPAPRRRAEALPAAEPVEAAGTPEVTAPPAQRQLPAPIRRTPPKVEEVQQQDAEEEVDVDNDPRMVEHNQRFDDAVESVSETENATEVRKLAKKMIKEGLIDEESYVDIDERMKDVPPADRWDEGMSALEDAIEQQRDTLASDIEDEIYSEADERQSNTRYSGRRDTVRAPRRKASEVVNETPLKKRDETVETEAKPEIDYDAVIKDRLDKIAERGAQGRIVANRLRSLLKQSNYNSRQLYYAFQMGEIVSRVLPKNSKVDILFVPSITATDAEAAAASGIDLGEETGGFYRAYKLSPSGFRGLITMSLSDSLLSVSRENAAHEAFHVIQDILQVEDPDGFDIINSSFRDGMRIADLDPSIVRKLKTIRTDGESSVYDNLVADFGDTPLARYEAQAVAFGALVDAKDRGVDMKGLKASFIRFVDFLSDMFREFRNMFDLDGVASIADIFDGFRTGVLELDGSLSYLGDLERDIGGVRYSGRQKPTYEHPSIGKQKINPPIAATSTIPFLYDNGNTKALQVPDEKMGLKDTVQFIQNRTREALMARFGVDRITGPSPKTDKYLKDSIAAEAEAAILKEMATGKRSALDWYTKAIEDAIKEASRIYPMLRDDDIAKRLSNSRGINSKEDARVMFTLALSITSQNMKVRDNARATTEQFDTFIETGRFDPSKKYGTKAPSITNNLALANYMLEKVFDGKVGELGQFLNTEFTVAELNALGRKVQAKDGLDKPPFKISGELASEMVYGSAIFGPKIGNGFYQNLNRNFSPVTIDLWFMRLWGRLTGTLVGNDTAINKQITSLREAVEADAHPSTKVPDGYAERFNEATDAEVVGLGIQLAAEWERQYKALQKQGMSSDEITEKGLKPDWAFKAVALAGQLKPNDAPTNGAQRKWIRDVVAGSVKMLAQKGYNVTPADLQALVWYPEKDLVNLFKEGKLEANLNVSYDTAFAELAAVRNTNATSANTDAGNRRSDGAPRQGDGGRGAGQAAVAGDQALAAGAVKEEGDQVRRTLPAEVRGRLIERGTRYSGRTGRGEGGNRGGEIAPLEGAPTNGGGPNPELVKVAEAYAVENGIPLTRQSTYVDIDEAFSRRLANAYEEMRDDPFNPDVRAAYADLIRQTRSQYDALERAGYKFTLFDDNSDPYGTNPWEAMRDLRNNKRMAVYSTVAGYGNDGAAFDVERNPLLADTGLRWPDQEGNLRPVLANDLFRAVHDAFGHGLEGAGFRARGEENAWQAHARLFTGPAVAALTSETRGQNSWLNFGPYGDKNKKADLFDTVFAEQKIGLMPEWTWTERVVDGEQPSNRAVYTLDRTEQILKDYTYPFDDKKSKGWMTFMSPDQFLGLTLSKDGRDRLATMDPTKTRARELNVDELRRVSQPLFLEIADPYMASGKEQPRRVMGHEGRHRMTAFKAAGIDQIPVILIRQNGAAQIEDLTGVQLAPQRAGRSDPFSNGDTETVIDEAVPINNENADRIRGMMAGEGVRFSGRRGRGMNATGPQALRPAYSFRTDNYNFGGEAPNKMDEVIYNLQDKLIDVKRIQKNIKDAGGRIDENSDVYRAEELFHGRAAKRAKDFINRELNPLLEEMKSKGVSLEMFDKFLHARHAKERNAQIRKINPDMQDKGSGLSDREADSYLAGLPKARRQQLDKLAGRVDDIINNTQKMMVQYGLETQDTISNWNKTYQFYVPLQREGFEEDGAGGSGQGMSVRGSSSRRALGSELGVVDILANIAMQRERVISRGERNRVGNALAVLALQNPNDSFWFVIDPKGADAAKAKQKLIDFGMDAADAENVMGAPMMRYMDPNTGRLVERPNTLFMNTPFVMATRINGEDKFIAFNSRNPRSQRMVTALKNIDAFQMGAFVSNLAKVTRYFAAINTQYNPAFGLYNLIRDLGGASVNLSSTPIAGKQRQVIGNALPAALGMYRDLRAERKGGSATTNWAALAEEFESEGGKTGYRDLFATSQDRAEAIEIELTGGSKARQIATKVGGPVFDWLSDFNEAIENGVRLSAYKTAKEAGLSKAEAASLAKNITVNFNRKGVVGAQAGAFYAFFNASVQGTARLAETISGPAGKKIIAGGILLGVAQAVALAAAGIDDEIPDWLADKNIVIPLGNKKYFAFPMPLGLHVIPSTSRRAVEFLMSGGEKAPEQVIGLMGMMADAFNPIGNAGLSVQTLTPTVIDPLVALGENRDFAGREIARQDFNTLDPTAGYERNKEGVSVVGDYMARAIDYMTGGNGYTAGTWSPTGDQVDYLIGQLTGGVGRLVLNTASTAEAVVTGEDLPNYKIPVVGRMIGDANEAAAISGRFYEGIKEMNAHKKTIEGMEEDGKDTTSYFKDNPEAEFFDAAQDYESDVRKLRKEKKQLKEEGASQEEIDYVTEETQMLMVEFNQRIADYKNQ